MKCGLSGSGDGADQARGEAVAGSYYPALTLRLGLAYHQAIIDVCDDFETQHERSG